ncbi:MAG TPA: glutaredoxin family protein [Rhodocyclaceae bacterium]|nr:glutaredoxin family protein [Rhodocyclaceae bacterium]
MRRLSLLALCLISTAVFAQTYRWVDPATGKTMITDTPPPGKVKQVSKTSSGGEAGEAQQSVAVQRAVENFPVTLYTSTDCAAACKNARDLLNRRGVPFTEKVLQTQEDHAELKTLVGETFVPTLKVGKQFQKGYLADAYNNLLDLAGYPTTAPYGSKPSGNQAPQGNGQ